MPDRFPVAGLNSISKVLEFDDRFTAPHFGFQGAQHYYDTQSAKNFLTTIRVPTLLVQAKDDPIVPFRLCEAPSIAANRQITLLAPDHGGHLGFLSRQPPPFWLDGVVVAWIVRMQNELDSEAVL